MEYTMQAVLNRNLVKYAVQTAMFCPKCKQILDVTRAVLFAVDGDAEGRQFMLCAGCYDNVRSLVTIDVLDGRKLWAKTETAAPDRNPVHAKDVAVGKRFETNQGLIVRILRVKAAWQYNPRTGCTRHHYVCLNERTGREITVKSAAKFRKEVA